MPLNDRGIVPARIKEARESRGLSMAELSEKIEVTSQAISQYEKGIINPSPFILKQLSNILEFPYSFFFKPIREKLCDNSPVFFRAMKSTPKKYKNAYGYYFEWADEIYNYLNKYVKLHELELPDISEYVTGEPLDFKTIEEIALSVRKQWGIGNEPISNFVELLEDKGITLCRIKFGNRKIDAFSQWYNGNPYIFLGSEKGSAVRSRFDAAHELGHLLLHPHMKLEDVYKKEKLDIIEAEANYFAGALLMPITSFPKEVIHNSIDYLLLLKEKWRVSISAIIMRSKQLNLFTENQINYLNRQMTSRQMWRNEPLDDILEPEEPRLFNEALELIIKHNIVTIDQFLNDICLPRREIQNICCLPDDFFTPVKKESKVELKIIK